MRCRRALALYPLASLLNHSCRPSVSMSFEVRQYDAEHCGTHSRTLLEAVLPAALPLLYGECLEGCRAEPACTSTHCIAWSTYLRQSHSDMVAGQQACGQGAAGSGARDGAAALLWPTGWGAHHAPAAAAAAAAVPLPLQVRAASCLDMLTIPAVKWSKNPDIIHAHGSFGYPLLLVMKHAALCTAGARPASEAMQMQVVMPHRLACGAPLKAAAVQWCCHAKLRSSRRCMASPPTGGWRCARGGHRCCGTFAPSSFDHEDMLSAFAAQWSFLLNQAQPVIICKQVRPGAA